MTRSLIPVPGASYPYQEPHTRTRHPVPSIRHPVPSIRHPVSSTQYPVSRVRYSTPRISLVDLELLYGRCPAGRTGGRRVVRQVGTRVGYTGWVPGCGIPGTTQRSSVGPWQYQCAVLRPPGHSRALAGPSAHPGSSHSDTGLEVPYGEIPS